MARPLRARTPRNNRRVAPLTAFAAVLFGAGMAWLLTELGERIDGTHAARPVTDAAALPAPVVPAAVSEAAAASEAPSPSPPPVGGAEAPSAPETPAVAAVDPPAPVEGVVAAAALPLPASVPRSAPRRADPRPPPPPCVEDHGWIVTDVGDDLRAGRALLVGVSEVLSSSPAPFPTWACTLPAGTRLRATGAPVPVAGGRAAVPVVVTR